MILEARTTPAIHAECKIAGDKGYKAGNEIQTNGKHPNNHSA
ncbi:MAG TPA: hypothetical protein VK666_28040 [Chryseolinea sp.]|nr:hypothetical protein [Chryseolinea sp.]